MPAFIPEILIAQFSNGVFTEDAPAGHCVHPAPRRAARGRSGEVLFTALALQARTPIPESEPDRLARLMTQVYFETPGSVTAALRAAFVASNAEVLPFSQASSGIASGPGNMAQMHAICAVMRDGDLYLGYGGNILALILREGGVQTYPAAGDSPARPLGTTLNIDLRYGHTVLAPAHTVILAAAPPAAWSSGVPSGLANLSLQAIGDRMAKQSASQAGSHGGMLVRFSQAEAPAKSAPPLRKVSLFPNKRTGGEIPQPAAPIPAAAPPARHGAPTKSETRTDASPIPPVRKIAPRDTTSASPPAAREHIGASSGPRPIPREAFPPSPAGEHGRPPEPERRAAADARFASAGERAFRQDIREKDASTGPGLSARDAILAFGRSIKITLSSGLEAVRSFLAGILPRGVLQENDRFILPPSVLLATAVAIPLVIVAVVAVMYFRKGYEMEFSRLMEAARTQAAVANAQTDPLRARQAWQEVFDDLQTAAKYGTSEELITLQNHTARMLDNFDGITPLEFKPAVAGGLEDGTQITVLLAGDRELYALDGVHDRVLRLLLGQGGYQLDETFICQAGEYPDITVGTLADMVWIPGLSVGSQTPSSTRSGAIVAMDRQGTLLYCPPGGKAMAGALTAPQHGWSTPSAIDYYNGRLYVLDPERNAFWRYAMSDSTGFDQAASAYFTADHPSMTDAIDFVIVSGEVFFLHADGHITRCHYDPLFEVEDSDSTGGTLCTTIPYNDTRPGRSAGPRIEDALLNRIYYNEPPEPTLFFLDPLGRGAYRFSLALNFISRYRVTIAPERHEATALAVGADKVLYIAIGNQIYYAQTRTP
ncbi:MAG: hypothetical protein JW748_15185 [Anaerolineales bacterium]|nr:hypothetical protein [Anaerolineales bacterium]